MKSIFDIIDNFLIEIKKETRNIPYLSMMFFVKEKDYQKIKETFIKSAKDKGLEIKKVLEHHDPDARFLTYRLKQRDIQLRFRVNKELSKKEKERSLSNL